MESLIWVAVFIVAMMALIVSLLSFYRANTYTLEQAQAVSDARRSIESVVEHLREADYANDGAYPIASMSTSSITFYANIDADASFERVHYYVEESSLKRGVLKPSGTPAAYTGAEEVTVISPYIRNIQQGIDTFHYFDSAGVEVVDMGDTTAVRFVRLDMIVNVSPARLPNELTVRSSAALRNIINEI